MKRQSRYLNSDLDLVAAENLGALTAALERCGLFPLHMDRHDDGRWYATLETSEQFTQPEPNIAAMLTMIETLDPHSRALCSACTTYEFNIGYECGDGPEAFDYQLTSATLARVAALGIALRITLYSVERTASEPSEGDGRGA